MLRFENKQILIVGVSSGIGRATAERLADEGASIIGVGRDRERIQNVLERLPGRGHHAVVADVSDEKQLGEIIKYGKSVGGYDGGLFCAGLHEIRPLTVLTADKLMNSFTANVVTTINCTKAITKAANPNGAGVVWMSSVAAIRGTAGFIAYASAKGALISAARAAFSAASRASHRSK